MSETTKELLVSIKNPDADLRKKYDWSKRSQFERGVYVVEEYPAVDDPEIVALITEKGGEIQTKKRIWRIGSLTATNARFERQYPPIEEGSEAFEALHRALSDTKHNPLTHLFAELDMQYESTAVDALVYLYENGKISQEDLREALAAVQ